MSSDSIMMTKDEIQFFKSYLDDSKVVLEYGCGGSTLYYSQLVKKYISIENETGWYKSIDNIKEDNTFMYLESPKKDLYDEELEKNAKLLLEGRYKQGPMSGADPKKKSTILKRNGKINFSGSQLLHTDGRDKHEWHTLINYVNKPLELIKEYGKFDIVLVDGVAREFCTYRAQDLIKDDGLIFFHDFKRPQYHGVLNFYEIVEQVDTLALLRLK